MKTSIIPILLIILVCFASSCDKKQMAALQPPRTDSIPATPAAANTLLDVELRWSEDIHLAPSYPSSEKYSAWSHYKIAQRHQTLVMKELPKYVTRLWGGGAIIEDDRLSAEWYFRVPPEHIKDFENYLVELRIPREYLHENHTIMVEEDEFYSKPKDRLNYGSTHKALADGDNNGVQLGKSVGGVAYILGNPNIKRASIIIRVAWKTGDVEVMENPRNPYDD